VSTKPPLGIAVCTELTLDAAGGKEGKAEMGGKAETGGKEGKAEEGGGPGGASEGGPPLISLPESDLSSFRGRVVKDEVKAREGLEEVRPWATVGLAMPRLRRSLSFPPCIAIVKAAAAATDVEVADVVAKPRPESERWTCGPGPFGAGGAFLVGRAIDTDTDRLKPSRGDTRGRLESEEAKLGSATGRGEVSADSSWGKVLSLGVPPGGGGGRNFNCAPFLGAFPAGIFGLGGILGGAFLAGASAVSEAVESSLGLTDGSVGESGSIFVVTVSGLLSSGCVAGSAGAVGGRDEGGPWPGICGGARFGRAPRGGIFVLCGGNTLLLMM